MAKTGQNFTAYLGNRATLHFPVVDQSNADAVLDNLDSIYTSVKWAMSQIDPNTGAFSTAAVLEKNSTVAQSETGGNEIDFASDAGTNDAADVELIGVDTSALDPGDYYHELEAFDSNGESIVLATGTITFLANVVNA